MVNTLNDQEIIDYLMTSDFNEGLTPDEFKFLLFKFRNAYRVISGRNDLLKVDISGKQNEIDTIKGIFNEELSLIKEENHTMSEKLKNIFERKLTWGERIKGKIIK